MQYWPLSKRGSHTLPHQGLHKLLWIKPRQACISVHLPVLSFCFLSPHTTVPYQLSLPSGSKECSSSSPACLCHVPNCLYLIQLFSNNIFVGLNTTSIQYTISLLYLSYHWANSKLSWPQCLSLSFFFFGCGPFLKSLICHNIASVVCVFWFFGHEACGILAPGPGIEPTSPALEGEVLTTGLPGKSPQCLFFLTFCGLHLTPELSVRFPRTLLWPI